MRSGDEAGFRDFARDRSLALRRTAFLLCGDWHLAEDLVQIVLIKLYRVWPNVARKGPVDNYARQVLLRCWLDERRRPWRRRERRDGVVPDVSGSGEIPGTPGYRTRCSALSPKFRRSSAPSSCSATAPTSRSRTSRRHCAAPKEPSGARPRAGSKRCARL